MRRLSILALACIVIYACDISAISDLCTGSGDTRFGFNGSLAPFNLAVGDSVTIDMENYWYGSFNCPKEDYTPVVYSAFSDSDNVEVRSNGRFVKIRALKSGPTMISVYPEIQSSNELCSQYNYRGRDPFEFMVLSGESPSLGFAEHQNEDNSLFITSISINPTIFAPGDTVLIKARYREMIRPGTYWHLEGVEVISGIRAVTDDCQSHNIGLDSLIVIAESDTIRGFHRVINHYPNGLMFHFTSD